MNLIMQGKQPSGPDLAKHPRIWAVPSAEIIWSIATIFVLQLQGFWLNV